jgi:anti-anti-sigma regulatory factor
MSDLQGLPREHASFVRTERSREEVVLAVDGPLFDEFADEFQRQLEALNAGGWPIVSLDLSHAKVMASNPIGKIVFFKKRLEEQRRTFRIRGCDRGLYEQFRRTKFDRIIDIEP